MTIYNVNQPRKALYTNQYFAIDTRLQGILKAQIPNIAHVFHPNHYYPVSIAPELNIIPTKRFK